MAIYVFLGAPGAGKGTLAERLVEVCGVLHISTGDILREEIRKETELGNEAKQYMDRGELAPDDLVAAIVSNKLQQPETSSSDVVLDGYPRNLAQAELLRKEMSQADLVLDKAVLFEVDRELLLKRLTARRVCSECGAVFNVIFRPPEKQGVCDRCGGSLVQRSDDTLDTAKERLNVYDKRTAPLIEYYENADLLVRVDANGTVEENFSRLADKLSLTV